MRLPPLLLRNARIFDGSSADCPEGMSVLVADGIIREISAKPIKATRARVIDVAGRTLMPSDTNRTTRSRQSARGGPRNIDEAPAGARASRGGRYWARTSDP